jgi:hypothetical protein
MRDVRHDDKHDPINKAAEHMTHVDSRKAEVSGMTHHHPYTLTLVLSKESEVKKDIEHNGINLYSPTVFPNHLKG